MSDREKLEKFLCEDVPDISEKHIWVWGAGNTAQLYQEGLKRMGKEELVIEGYVDSDPSKIGKMLGGKPVNSPETLKEMENVCVLICTVRPEVVKEVSEQLEGWHLEWYLFDEVVLKKHSREVLQCYDLMEDEQSKKVYESLIEWRITGQRPEIKIETGKQYFSMEQFVKENKDEVFVDCGAYIGDTIEEYLKQKNGIFKKIIAFEPDEVNFGKLNSQIELEKKKWNLLNNQIVAYPYGVAQNSGKGKFEHYEPNAGLGSKMIEALEKDDGNCNIISLDEFLTEQYMFLKADIESYEYQMLLGAQNGIKTNKPLLAICIYHNAVDLYSIPLLIKKLVPEYKIAVRHYTEDLSETLLYAWV